MINAANLLKREVIVAAGDNLRNLSLEWRGQLTDEILGMRCCYLGMLWQNWKPHAIQSHFLIFVRKFYMYMYV